MRLAHRTTVLVLAVALSACSSGRRPPDDRSEAVATEASAQTPAVDAVASSPVGTWKINGPASLECSLPAIAAAVAEAQEAQKRMLGILMTGITTG